MTDRKSMDGAATGMAIILGTILTTIGVAGIVLLGGLQVYDVAWAESPVEGAMGSASLTTSETSSEVMASFTDSHVSSVVITTNQCNDQFTQAIGSAATITWTLTEEVDEGGQTVTQVLDSQEFTCADAEEMWTIPIDFDSDLDRPDEIDAATAAEANSALATKMSGHHATGSYTLTLSYQRAPDQLPLGLLGQGSALAADFGLAVHEWHATITTHEEVIR